MRHEKYSSIGRDLTSEIFEGKTYKTFRPIKSIAVHCSATPNNKSFDAKDIDRWHLERWGKNSGCGYHYVVLLDGTIEKGRWLDYPGAHVKNFNKDTIGICYIGGLDKDGNVNMDSMTSQQHNSLITLLSLLVDMYDLETSDVLGHKEYPNVNKACPCLTMDSIREEI